MTEATAAVRKCAAIARTTAALAACALAACAASPTPDFSGGPGGARSGSCVEDCRLTVTNQSDYRVVVSAYHGSALRQLAVLPPNASQEFTVPRSVRTVVAEVNNQEFCRGPVHWRTDGSADFIVGGPSCSAVVLDSLVLAGGCYWGVEAVFEHVTGILDVVSGFGVPAEGDSYAEAVRVTFDPAQIGREQLLEVFFTVAHDPTQLDRQGPDIGPQYRSIVFVEDGDGRRTAEAYLERLRASGDFHEPIVTEVSALGSFEPAPPDQQDYVARNPTSLYVLINDLPKLAHLQQRFPELWRERDESPAHVPR